MDFIEEEPQDDYFTSYNDMEVHYLMLKDKPRTLAYMNAIQKAQHDFKDKIVLDVGCGTGILSMFAAKIGGAKKVYAVEASGMYQLAQNLMSDNKLSKVIEIVHGQVEDIKLPEKVDIIISEWMGFYLFHESMFDSVLFARNKWLKKDGIMFPSHAKLYGAPCNVPDAFEKVAFWKDCYGFDFSRLEDSFFQELMSKPLIQTIFPKNLLSKPQTFAEFDLKTIQQSELKEFACKQTFEIENTSSMHGIAIWWDCSFHPSDVILSTSPMEQETHWKQTIILLPSPTGFLVKKDEEIPTTVIFQQDESNYRNYNISVELG